MDAQKRLDKILKEVHKRTQEELSSLLGVTLSLADTANTLVTRDTFAENARGKQIVADINISGDIEGRGSLVVGVKEAIHLGGTLIMLPQSELAEVAEREEYGEEIEDSYGEIANIIAGSYTKVFEETYSKNCRFIRREQCLVDPVSMEFTNDEPLVDQTYYQVKSRLILADDELGNITMLLPAKIFGLDAELDNSASELADPAGETQVAAGQDTQQSQSVAAVDTPEKVNTPEVVKKRVDPKKHRQRIDTLLKASEKAIASELTDLLGTEVVITGQAKEPVSKEHFFDQEVEGKQIIANLDIAGDREGQGYLFIDLKAAIHTGGVLVMLPASELESVAEEEDFNDDLKDAYGEIANIISGVFSRIFEEQYSESIRFTRRDIDQLVPLQVEVESEEPFANQICYMSSMSVQVGGQNLGMMRLLLPTELLDLDHLEAVQKVMVEAGLATAAGREGGVTTPTAGGPAEGASPAQAIGAQGRQADGGETSDPGEFEAVDILLISDNQGEASKVLQLAQSRGYRVRHVNVFDDGIRSYLTADLKAVYLVMEEVNEQAFGVAIKVSSSCDTPLIAAGPAWTRSTVIKAVRYGVNDILLTPASEGDINENLDNNLMEMAA